MSESAKATILACAGADEGSLRISLSLFSNSVLEELYEHFNCKSINELANSLHKCTQ